MAIRRYSLPWPDRGIIKAQKQIIVVWPEFSALDILDLPV
jgi:hypothetical protein